MKLNSHTIVNDKGKIQDIKWQNMHLEETIYVSGYQPSYYFFPWKEKGKMVHKITPVLKG